jgi:SulP family sulfate permease
MPAPSPGPAGPTFIELFTPKLVTALREGYGFGRLRRDAVAGLTVAIVALPLAIAIAIASGASPSAGIITAIIGGFLISALGGSRFQIGGPTAAFIVVVFHTIERHGYDGLLTATIIAGFILIGFGLLRLGTFIKYIPYPVVVGFTAGIAVSIFASEIKDLLGLEIALPADFVPKVTDIANALPQTNFVAVGISLLALALILGLRRYRPGWPGFLIAVAATSAVTALFNLDTPTIGSAFGGVPAALPSPHLPAFDLNKIGELIPDAITIAFLAGIESLLSAVIADGMTGRRHRSNCELVAQGVANIGAALFGGISATGAIARTATNIRAGAQTPVAGMLHSVFLLVFVLAGASLLAYVPLAALAAILAVVAWNIAEFGHIRRLLMSGTVGDRAVLATTFLLTVFVDLTTAIEVGVVLAALLFMHRMANAVEIETGGTLIDEDRPDTSPRDHAVITPDEESGVVVYRINGPFFFGATEKFSSTLNRMGRMPRLLILDLSDVPFVDSTAATALRSFVAGAQARQTTVVLVGVKPSIRNTIAAEGLTEDAVRFALTVEAARAIAPRGDRS